MPRLVTYIALGLGLAILIVAALWVVGGRTQVVEVSVDLPVPPGEAFTYLTDPDRLSRWIGGLVESKPLGDGELRVGARSVETVENNGRPLEIRSEVLELEPGRLLRVSLDSDYHEGENRFELEPLEGGQASRVRQRLELTARGVVRVFTPFMTGTVESKTRADLDRLRGLVVEDVAGQ